MEGSTTLRSVQPAGNSLEEEEEEGVAEALPVL